MVLRFVVDVHTTCFGLHGHLQVCKIFSFLVPSLILSPHIHPLIGNYGETKKGTIAVAMNSSKVTDAAIEGLTGNVF
jgi:hypothetical protein